MEKAYRMLSQQDDEIDTIFSENFEKPPGLQNQKQNQSKKKKKKEKKETDEVSDPTLQFVLQAIVNSKK